MTNRRTDMPAPAGPAAAVDAAPFHLPAPPAGGPLAGGLYARTTPALEKVLGLAALNDIYHRVAGAADVPAFLQRVLEDHHVRVRVARQDLDRIPRTGPFVVVANHPFGALDGIILASVLTRVRPDVKVMANYLLGRIPALRDLFVCVDPFGGGTARAANVGPMRQALRWLQGGGVLATFPAGEVAHLRWRDLCDLRDGGWRLGRRPVTDAAWDDTVGRIVRRAGVPVLPVYFDGQNGPLFQLAGLLSDRLRTALLPREFLNKRHAEVELRIGSVVPARRLAGIDGDEAVTGYLRGRTFLLRHTSRADAAAAPAAATNADAPAAPPPRAAAAAPIAPPSATPPPPVAAPRRAPRIARFFRPARPRQPAVTEPVIPPVDPGLLAADVAALPPEALLVEHDDYAVLQARAPQVRHVLRELGRLREVTFRAAGEGTGKAIDLDTFDYDYLHLFIWNKAKGEVVGAYRLGATDELLPAKGRLGLYTSTLFNYKAALLRRIDPALELGRSFVRVEYQRSYAPLLLLWKGIGQYLVRRPRYRHLFGPVSISASYQTVSRQAMVQFLRLRHGLPGGPGLAPARNPFRARPPRGWDEDVARALLAGATDDGDVSDLVADLEPDTKGIPVLIRQYLKLGAKFVEFNVDPDFSDALDGLIVIDLTATDPRTLERYMGRDGYASFMAHHRSRAALRGEQLVADNPRAERPTAARATI